MSAGTRDLPATTRGADTQPGLGGRLRRWIDRARQRCERDGYPSAMTSAMTSTPPGPSTHLPPGAADDRHPDSFPGPGEGLTAAGLTTEDIARIGAAYAAAQPRGTRRVYAQAWRQWERCCTHRGLTPLPADPHQLCAYLTERAATGTTVATLAVACSAIGHRHRTHQLPDPLAHPTVQQVRAGLRRHYGTAPAARPGPSRSSSCARSWPEPTAPTPPARSGTATPPSSCSATPAPCAAASSST